MYACMYVCTYDYVRMYVRMLWKCIYANNILLLYLSYKCTIHVNNFLFLISLLRASMFIHHPREFLICVKITKLLYMVT